MKNIWENGWFAIPVLLFFNAGLVVALYTSYGEEIVLLNNWRFEPLNTLFQGATLLGEVHAYVALGLMALFFRYRYALLIALAGLITLPTVYFIKESFGIDRPITYFRNRGLAEWVVTVPGVDLNIGQTSFPSGHTMAAFALYGLLAAMIGSKYPKWGLLCAVLAIATGISRVFLVQHFLVDILAGATLGLAVCWLVLRIDRSAFFQNARWLDGRPGRAADSTSA